MGKHRIRPGSGWKNHKELPLGPNGRALCRWCGVEVPKGRRSFCSDDCVHEHKLRSDPGYLREQVFQRDFGVCALCGTDCDKVMRVFKALLRKAGLKAAQFPRKVEREPERYGRSIFFGCNSPGSSRLLAHGRPTILCLSLKAAVNAELKTSEHSVSDVMRA